MGFFKRKLLFFKVPVGSNIFQRGSNCLILWKPMELVIFQKGCRRLSPSVLICACLICGGVMAPDVLNFQYSNLSAQLFGCL